MFSQELQWLLGEKYAGQKSEAFLADAALLEQGVPLAYLIGSIPFLNATIYLDSHPLIPRPETEFWVEEAIKMIQPKDPYLNHNSVNKRLAAGGFDLGAAGASEPSCDLGQESESISILDLCAGSGAVGVAVAKALPNSLVDFAELDSAHLPTIAKNCRENGISPLRVHIYASNLFSRVSGELLPRYDIILSNPPYIDKSLGRTEASVVAHEPALALYGGVAGLEIIAQIIKEAPNHLNPGGQLWLEHEPEQAEALAKLAAPLFSISTQKDQYGVLRYSILMLQ